MAKTKEELNELKIEFKTLAYKLNELNEEELEKVTGGLAEREKEQPDNFDQQLLDILLNSKSLADLVNDLNYFDIINQKNKETIEEFTIVK